jgi:peptidyl-prolyl cis-trans isomerase C
MRSAWQFALGSLLLALTLWAIGCGLRDRFGEYFSNEEDDAVVLRIGDKSYTHADLDGYFAARLGDFVDPESADAAKSNLLDLFIEDRLLLQRAESLKIEASDQALKAMIESITSSESPGQTDGRYPGRSDENLEQGLRESLKIQRYLSEYVLKDVHVTEEECEAYYKEHLDEYVSNDVVRVREILVNDDALVQKIYELLKAKGNRNFADLARLYSAGATAASGGDLGTFHRGELPEEFEKAIFSVSPGTVSRLVRSQYGYHIFLVEEKILAHQQKFYEVKEVIREKLQLEREREHISKELESLKMRTPVEIRLERLGFNYVGNRLPR